MCAVKGHMLVKTDSKITRRVTGGQDDAFESKSKSMSFVKREYFFGQWDIFFLRDLKFRQ